MIRLALNFLHFSVGYLLGWMLRDSEELNTRYARVLVYGPGGAKLVDQPYAVDENGEIAIPLGNGPGGTYTTVSRVVIVGVQGKYPVRG